MALVPKGQSGGKRPGTFQKGHVGNPGGKQPGTKHRTTRLVEEIMENGTKSIIDKMVALGQGGDVAAARLILERVLPPRRSRPVEFDLPAGSDPVAAIGSVLAGVSAGTLSPDEGASIVGMLEAQRRMIETSQLEERIAKLEATLAERAR